MKTLVIHPTDPTTDFLKAIYVGKPWTVISHFVDRQTLKTLISSYDKIIMMGHGTPAGLIGHGSMVITEEFAPLLAEKECVFIWCNADKFVERHNLKGFYTGMIISEVEEALYCDVDTTPEDIKTSNALFASLIREGFNAEIIKSRYVSETNEVIKYNTKNIYSK